jgi:hypothetical protein
MVMIGTPFGSHDETAQQSLDHPGTCPGNDPQDKSTPPITRKSKTTREKLFMMKAETVIPL